jgi:hypothetical protein
MKLAALLALFLTMPSLADAQTGRRALESGRERYLLADYRGALPLLSTGLDPGAGSIDSLWTTSVERLADLLLVLRRDSLAATWLRWAMRVAPGFWVNEDAVPPAVLRAARGAQAFVDSTPSDPFVAAVRFDWPRTALAADQGMVRLAAAAIPITARIGANQFLRGGEIRRLEPGSYDVVVSAPGYLPTRLTVEVLPGVTSVIAVSLLPETSALLTVVTRPWATLFVDDRRIGYTPVAAHRIAPGRHAIRLQRGSQSLLDTAITVLERQRLRLTWLPVRDTTGDPRVDSALALLDAGETERGAQRLEDVIGAGPLTPGTAGITALARLAEAIWALGDRDSARVCLHRLVVADPFYAWPSDIHPDLRSAYARERRRTPAIALRAVADTVITPATDVWPVEIAVGRPGDVRLSLRLTPSRPRDSILTVLPVDSVIRIGLYLTFAEGGAVPPGRYTLIADIGARGTSEQLEFVVERQMVDTLPHESRSVVERPESRRGGVSRRTFVQGVGLGAASFLITMMINDGDLSGRELPPGAVAIGASVTIASLLGRRGRDPIPENIAHNAALRAQWTERQRGIAAENARRLNGAPMRIRTARTP